MYGHEFTIEDLGINDDLGQYTLQGSVAPLLAIPSFKPSSIRTVSWQEETGMQAELSAPVFRSRDFQLKLWGSDLMSVWSAASPQGYFTLSVENTLIDLSKCRLRGVSSYSALNGVQSALFNITSDDDPRDLLDEYADYSPSGGASYTTPYSLYEPAFGNIGALGIQVLDGWRNTLAKPGDPKMPMTRDVSVSAGMLFDDVQTLSPKTSARKISIPCLLHTGASLADFWARYYCLLYWLTKPGEIIITQGVVSPSSLHCYYDSMTVNEYVPSEPVPWLKFTVNMNVLNY